MNSGDFIECASVPNGAIVDEADLMYSQIMLEWVPIGGKSLLISITDKELVWFHIGTNRIACANLCYTRYAWSEQSFLVK